MPALALDRVNEHHFISSWLGAGNDQGKLLIVDLGMNAGEFSREMLRRYDKLRIVAVEANPELAAAVDPHPSLRCYNYAIAPKSGKVTFGIDPDNSTASSLNDTGNNTKNVTVEGIRFADFLAKMHLEDEFIDLLKIDIEGSELELFEDTPAHLFAKVRQIAVEFHAFMNPDHLPRIARIIERMETLGFHCIDFTTNFQDVLMVNKKSGLSTVGPVEMIKMSLTKYSSGVKRKLAKLV